jgi:hypothetical protein
MMTISRIDTTEEFWPGQKEGIRTARIEVWVEGSEQPVEVGRITAESELFCELRDIIERDRPGIKNKQGVTKQYRDMYAGTPEPTSYVSEDGLVLLPDHVISGMGLEDGGGVCFVKPRGNHYELWTVEEFEGEFL